MLSGDKMIQRTSQTVQYLKSKNPDAVAGLRRGVIDYLKEKTFVPSEVGGIEEALASGKPFEGKVLGGTFMKEYQRIRPALEKSKLFTDSQLRGFDELYNDKASQLSVRDAKIPGDSGTAQSLSTLAAMRKIAGSGFLKAASLIPGGKFVASYVEPLLKSIPESKFQAALEEALLNPRYARDLQNKATAKNVSQMSQTIFKNEFDAAFGDATLGGAAATSAKILAPNAPTLEKKKKPVIPKQQTVTSNKSFPDPKELLAPPAKGVVKKTSFNLENLPAETRARITVESGGNPDAVSPKGAQGLSQLMPETAKEVAAQLGETYYPITPGMTELQREISIDQNIRIGNEYYNQMLKRFKNPTLAWAAYNAGPGRVETAIKQAGTSTDVQKILASLPKGVQKETIPYTQNVNEIMQRLKMG